MTNSKKISKINSKYIQRKTITNRKNLLKNYSKKNIHNKNLHFHRGGALPPLISDSNYFQKQESAACGRHALNNLMGGEFFIKGIFNTDEKYTDDEINETGINLSNESEKQFNLLKLCKYIAENTAVAFTNPDNFCQANENYDTNVLELALQVCGFDTENRTGPLFIEELELDKNNLLGYIINYGGGHWVTLKYTPDKNPLIYTLVNSTSYDLDKSTTPPSYKANNLFFKTIDEYKTSMTKNKTNLVRTILVKTRDEQIKIVIDDDIKEAITKNEKELEEKKKKLIAEKQKLQTGTDALSLDFIKLIEYYYENNTDTDMLNNIFDTDHTILKELYNKLQEIQKNDSERHISITAYDTFINLYNKLTTKSVEPVNIGLDYDGVLSLNVKPLLNSKDSRLCCVSNKLVGNNLELNEDFIKMITELNNINNNYILTKNRALIYADLHSDIQKIVNNDNLEIIIGQKIDKLKNHEITHFFDDSNINIFEIMKTPPTNLKKLYKVFPETIFDLYDNLNVKADGTKNNSLEPKDKPLGTLNPKMVEIPKDNQKIKILTYNINHEIKFDIETDKLSKLIVELKKYTETDNVDFICLQEFAYVELNVDALDKIGKNLKNHNDINYKKFDEQISDKQNASNNPLNKINNLETDDKKKISKDTLGKYKYVYNFQPAEHQFTFYDSTKYEIDKDEDKELIIRGNTDLRGGRPFTLIVFKNKASREKLVLINVHFPHTLSIDKKIIKNNDMINNFIVSWINNIIYDSTNIEPSKPKKTLDIPAIAFYSTTNKLVKEFVKDKLLNTRIIVAGDFNRTVFSNSKTTSHYSNNKELGIEIDNSAYGLKLFKGLYDDSNKDKSIIMYNIPPPNINKKFDKNTCSGNHIDNVLDSFGLQESYVYGEISVSDHLPVLVTLLGAKPIYNLDILKTELQSGASSGIKVKVDINYCYD